MKIRGLVGALTVFQYFFFFTFLRDECVGQMFDQNTLGELYKKMKMKALVVALITGSLPRIKNNVNQLKTGFAIAIVCAVVLTGSVASGQGIVTGTLTATVQDSTGAVIVGAKITVTKTDTNTVFTAATNAQGSFSLNDLPVGIYTVKIENQGFSVLAVNDVHVDANRTQSLGIQKLVTGGTAATVEVNAAETLLETTQSQVTTTFDTQQVSQLPVGGGFDELALLIPGVVATHGENFSNTNGTGVSSNGQRFSVRPNDHRRH